MLDFRASEHFKVNMHRGSMAQHRMLKIWGLTDNLQHYARIALKQLYCSV